MIFSQIVIVHGDNTVAIPLCHTPHRLANLAELAVPAVNLPLRECRLSAYAVLNLFLDKCGDLTCVVSDVPPEQFFNLLLKLRGVDCCVHTYLI